MGVTLYAGVRILVPLVVSGILFFGVKREERNLNQRRAEDASLTQDQSNNSNSAAFSANEKISTETNDEIINIEDENITENDAGLDTQIKKIKTEEHNLNQRRAEDASLTQDHNNNSNGAALSANENISTETNDETINIEDENITENDAGLDTQIKKIKTEEHNLNQRRAEDASLTQDHNNSSNSAALSANENISTETNDETINIEDENITENDAGLDTQIKKIKTEEHNLNQRRAEDALLAQDQNNSSNSAAFSANENISTETNDETINIEDENITENDAGLDTQIKKIKTEEHNLNQRRAEDALLAQDQNNSSNSAAFSANENISTETNDETIFF